MIPLLSKSQIEFIDKETLRSENLSSIELMEQACVAFVHKFRELYPDKNEVVSIICGRGNNAGDGLAIARMLNYVGYSNVSVVLVNPKAKSSENFDTNLKRLEQTKVPVNEMFSHAALDEFIDEKAIIIDAIFGSGFRSPLRGLEKNVVAWLNDWRREVISVDMPSGMQNDCDLPLADSVVRAKHCITFELPKLPSFFPDQSRHVGQWHVVKIGLDQKAIKGVNSKFYLLEEKDIKTWMPKRGIFSHKGEAGRALLIAGSESTPGAALLAAEAALRSGLGLLSLHCPSSINSAVSSRLPEAMLSDSGPSFFTKQPVLDKPFDAVAIGPGLGTEPETRSALNSFLKENNLPITLDADAINLLSANSPEDIIKEGTILTPHMKEFDRFFGEHNSWMGRIKTAQAFCDKRKVVILLKNAFTFIISPNAPVLINPNGNAGMATAGSGDVLSGIVLSLIASGINPSHAAAIGAYVHGSAGDLTAEELSMESMIASDIIKKLAAVFIRLAPR